MMKHKRNIKLTAFLAFLISLAGFFLDSDPRETSIFTNIFEIALMTSILFGVFSLVYFFVNLVSRLIGFDVVSESE